MNNGFVNQEIKNNIATITFATPKSNSLPGEILELLSKTILESGKDRNVKAILLKSEGEKAFCAGASFDELLEIEELEKSKIFFGGFAKVLNATATLPSENASKKPQGPRKTPMGRTGRAQLPSGICSNEIVKALLKGHKRGPMVEKHNPPLPSSRPEPATWYRAALRLLKA